MCVSKSLRWVNETFCKLEICVKNEATGTRHGMQQQNDKNWFTALPATLAAALSPRPRHPPDEEPAFNRRRSALTKGGRHDKKERPPHVAARSELNSLYVGKRAPVTDGQVPWAAP